jgi:hypothetical protein
MRLVGAANAPGGRRPGRGLKWTGGIEDFAFVVGDGSVAATARRSRKLNSR